MNRRTFLKRMAALPVVAVAAATIGLPEADEPTVPDTVVLPKNQSGEVEMVYVLPDGSTAGSERISWTATFTYYEEYDDDGNWIITGEPDIALRPAVQTL